MCRMPLLTELKNKSTHRTINMTLLAELNASRLGQQTEFPDRHQTTVTDLPIYSSFQMDEER
jgi:hypothetical protein